MHQHTLQCSDIVFRALLRATHIDRKTGHILAAAFILRANECGLSVSFDCTPEECAAHFKTCHGVVSLHVGRVRNLGLDVIPDDTHHANIVGLPHPEEKPAEAEHVARQLQAQARLAWSPTRPGPAGH